MPRGKKFTAKQIIGKLREAEVGLAQGKTVPEAVRKLGVTEQTYYRCKREYGGQRPESHHSDPEAGCSREGYA
jgi:putative transposase